VSDNNSKNRFRVAFIAIVVVAFASFQYINPLVLGPISLMLLVLGSVIAGPAAVVLILLVDAIVTLAMWLMKRRRRCDQPLLVE
jgi:uncharacterized membrane protein